jgi:dienelactone hydrolase
MSSGQGAAVEGFEPVTDSGAPWPVYRDGTGPPVVVIHELNGLTAPVLAFARRVVDAGFTVYLPVLAGPVPATSGTDKLRAALRVCVKREIELFLRPTRTSGVVTPLQRLAEHAAEEAGDPRTKVGVVGMCFSGGFALALAGRPSVVAAGVAAQPSLPLAHPVTPWCAKHLGLDDKAVAGLKQRLTDGQTALYVTRFSEDKVSPKRRLRTMRNKLGTVNVTIDELPSYPDNEFGFAAGDHSVLSAAPAKYPAGSAAAARLEQAFGDVIAFLKDRLA